MYLNYASNHPIKWNVKEELIQNGFDYNNPSDKYKDGRANEIIEQCKVKLSKVLDFSLDDYEVIFTSGATEANQTVLSNYNGKTVLTTPIEHSSIIKCSYVNFKYAEIYKEDGEIAKVDKIDFNDVDLCSTYLLHNETGNENDWFDLVRYAHKNGIPVHIDATQAVGRVYFSLNSCKPDYVTISGHKFGALSGIGALIVLKGRLRTFNPFIYGSQNGGYRGGTENIIGIHSMLLALDGLDTDAYWLDFYKCCNNVYDYLDSYFRKNDMHCWINTGEASEASYGILSITAYTINGKVLKDVLDEVYDIQVSTGSACLAGERSYVLEALGWNVDHTIRISFGADGFDVQYFAECMKKVIDKYGDISLRV